MENTETNQTQTTHGQTIIVNHQEPAKSNGMGVAGFVLSLITLFLGWIPFVGWILWVLGLVFSAVGIFRQPKGLAIAGLVISLLGVIVILILSAAILAIFGLATV